MRARQTRRVNRYDENLAIVCWMFIQDLPLLVGDIKDTAEYTECAMEKQDGGHIVAMESSAPVCWLCLFS